MPGWVWKCRSPSILVVRLPEPLPRPDLQLDTIADIGKARIRRVIGERVIEEFDQTLKGSEGLSGPKEV